MCLCPLTPRLARDWDPERRDWAEKSLTHCAQTAQAGGRGSSGYGGSGVEPQSKKEGGWASAQGSQRGPHIYRHMSQSMNICRRVNRSRLTDTQCNKHRRVQVQACKQSYTLPLMHVGLPSWHMLTTRTHAYKGTHAHISMHASRQAHSI